MYRLPFSKQQAPMKEFFWVGWDGERLEKKNLLSRRCNWKCFQKNIASYQGGKLSFTLPAFSKLLFTIFLQWKISGLFDSCQVFFPGNWCTLTSL